MTAIQCLLAKRIVGVFAIDTASLVDLRRAAGLSYQVEPESILHKTMRTPNMLFKNSIYGTYRR